MKLLFDHNLSFRLVQRMMDVFPDAQHVAYLGLERASDGEIWTFAHTNNLMIVTKDADFNDLSTLQGFPPKIIWLRLGNCTTTVIEQTLRNNHKNIQDFHIDSKANILEILS